MRKLFLIRHGESQWNVLRKIQGQKDTNLTELGEKQALSLAKKLLNEDIDTIVTSDLKRAYNTGKIISDFIDKPISTNKYLREINFGIWEGLTIEEIKENHSTDYRIWKKEPEKLQVEGGESFHRLRDRGLKAINDIFKKYNSKNIAIVSHSATIKTLILGLLDMDLSCYNKLSIDNVSLSIIEFRDFNNVLTLLNDVSHLRGMN